MLEEGALKVFTINTNFTDPSFQLKHKNSKSKKELIPTETESMPCCDDYVMNLGKS